MRSIRGAGPPPAMLDGLEGRLRSRAAPGIHGSTTPDAPSL
jgi:hypothetical protein